MTADSKSKYVPRKIFKSVTEEIDTSVRSALDYDAGFLELDSISN